MAQSADDQTFEITERELIDYRSRVYSGIAKALLRIVPDPIDPRMLDLIRALQLAALL